MGFIRGLILITVLVGACWSDDENPTVTTPLGSIRGYHKLSFGGRKFSAFEGIPFAKPPIGERRFEEPEPIKSWTGTWNAVMTSECSQSHFMTNGTVGDEDCLHLNVYVPRLNPNPEEKLEVIVHVHGGAFMLGSGHGYSKPDLLMGRDFIFVTFNYRLGILGFLSTEDHVVPGNNGLKDQVLALKWVKDNIASFGGNPDSVTLTGLSAGAVGVHFHYFSPLSKGLFHRGWAQSGVVLNPWAIQEEPLKKSQLIAQTVGCPTTPSQLLVDCLKERPAAQILSTLPLFDGFKFSPIAPFAPVIEKGAKKPFLSVDPYYLLAKGKVHDLPFIASTTNAEGLVPAILFKDDLKEINEKWVELAPHMLDFNYTLSKTLHKNVAEQIKDYYLGKGEDINEDNFRKLVKLFGDRLFLTGAETAARLQAKATTSPVYFYYFGYPGDDKSNPDVSHAGDAQYLFTTIFGKKLSENELKMSDLFLDLLDSFSKTGRPQVGVTWEPTGSEELTYLDITSYEPDGLNLKTVEELTPRNFWTSLGFLENENIVSVKDEL